MAKLRYKGFTTKLPSNKLYDMSLAKQDLLNHFYVRKGERLMNPDFGTIIWDLLFEPLTEELKTAITLNVEAIINHDPRVRAENVIVTTYDSGLQIECTLTYMPYNISESLQFRFDQANGLIN